jgi:hypothetical protein
VLGNDNAVGVGVWFSGAVAAESTGAGAAEGGGAWRRARRESFRCDDMMKLVDIGVDADVEPDAEPDTGDATAYSSTMQMRG